MLLTVGEDIAAGSFGDYVIGHAVTSGDPDYEGLSVADRTVKLTFGGLLVSPLALSLDEGATGSYEVSLVSQPDGEVTVNIRAPDGLRVAPDSLTFTSSGANIWSTPQTVMVTAVDDDISTGQRWLSILNAVKAAGTNYVEAPNVRVLVSITDDEALPELRLTLNPAWADEGGQANDDDATRTVRVNVTVELVGPARSWETTLNLATGASGDSATAGEDYIVANLPASVMIPAGMNTLESELSFDLRLVQDRLDEGMDEFFTVTVEDTFGVLDGDAAVFTIVDDD